MKIKPVLAWYDGWIGYYWDREKRTLYLLPLPCIGFKLIFKPKNIEMKHYGATLKGKRCDAIIFDDILRFSRPDLGYSYNPAPVKDVTKPTPTNAPSPAKHINYIDIPGFPGTKYK